MRVALASLAAVLTALPVALAAADDKTPVPLRASDALAADLDRDRDVDVAVVGQCKGKRTTCLAGVENVRRKLGTVRTVELRGVTLAGASVAQTPRGVVLAGDGGRGPDLVVLRSTGPGTLAFAQRFDVPGGVRDVAVGDVNGDGRPDVVFAGRTGIGVLDGRADGSFAAPVVTDVPGAPLAVSLGRLDGDAFVDIAYVTTNRLFAVELSGGGIVVGDDAPLRRPAVDLDVLDVGGAGDATPDIAVATATGVQLVATVPDAGGLDLETTTFLAGTRPVGVVLADVTRDNLVDVITLNAGSGNVSVNVATAGGGYGTPIRSLPVGANPVSLSVLNFDNDGIPDVVVANAAGAGLGAVTVLTGNGRGGFTTGAALPPSTGSLPLDFTLAWNHPQPNQGFSWLCADIRAASGGLLSVQMTGPGGQTLGGTLQLKKKETATAPGSFSFKIDQYGEYTVTITVTRDGKSTTKTKKITVTSAQGSSSCGP